MLLDLLPEVGMAVAYQSAVGLTFGVVKQNLPHPRSAFHNH